MALRPLLSSLCLVLSPALAAAQTLPAQSPRVVSYAISARLDEQARTVTGSERIRYQNRSGAPVRDIWLHLYYNAFRKGSTLMREASKEFRDHWKNGDHGEMRVTRLTLKSASGDQDLTAALQPVAPDDGNPDDRSVFMAALPAPVPEADYIDLELEFTAKIPKAWRRTGWAPGNFFMMVQWFPKLGVLESVAGLARWNCHQFHANTEFFADFGDYEVNLDVPRGYEVGATGGRPTKDEEQAGRRHLTFVQRDVHDFAWVCDPDLRRHERKFVGGAAQDQVLIARQARALGRDPASLALSDVDVILLLHPEHDTETLRERHFDAVFKALAFYGSRYGRYPYPYVTAVDPATDSELRILGGGMEYPTLFTCGSPLIPHGRELSPEGVTIHEFGHQFWYGLSGNNEFEEAWLDEGLNTYSEGRCQDLQYADRHPVRVTRFGPLPFQGLRPAAEAWLAPRLPRIPQIPEHLHFSGTVLHDLPLLRALREAPFLTYGREARLTNLYGDRDRYLGSPQADVMVRNGWEYRDAASYRVNAYQRPATLLNTLERQVGGDKWWLFLRQFHEQSRFRRPTTPEFVSCLRSVAGAEAADLFEQHVTGRGRLDYGIQSVKTEKDAAGHRSEVVVQRTGDMVVPVTVRFVFAGRKAPIEEVWPAAGQYYWKRWVFADSAQESFGELLEVRVDPPLQPGATELADGPAGVYVLDQNLLDNAWCRAADHEPALARAGRSLLLAQSMFTFFGFWK